MRVRRHQRRVADGSPRAVVGVVLTRPQGEVTYCRPSALRAGGPTITRRWRYAEHWGRWRRAELRGLVSLKGGLKRVVIRQLKALSIVGFPIPIYHAQTGTWQPQKTSASG